MKVLISIIPVLFVVVGLVDTTPAYDRLAVFSANSSPRQVAAALFWLLVIIMSAIAYYHSKSMNRVLLYSGIALSVCIVILVTGRPPLPKVLYTSFSKLGVLPALLLFSIVLLIVGRELVLRIKPWLNTHTLFTAGSGAQTFSAPFQTPWTSVAGRYVETLYHGTPRVENAQDILNYGFLIGEGNLHGSGLYLGDLQTAKAYTKGTGVIIKVKLDVPASQVANYHTIANSPGFKNWSSAYGSGNQGDDISNYTVRVLKKRFFGVNPNFYVALANKTNPDERIVFEGITILGVLDARGNPV